VPSRDCHIRANQPSNIHIARLKDKYCEFKRVSCPFDYLCDLGSAFHCHKAHSWAKCRAFILRRAAYDIRGYNFNQISEMA
jgi:hypothetical protein